MEELKKFIREVPDFPKPGIVFKDITPLLLDGPVFKKTIHHLVEQYSGKGINKVIGIESRGFIFGAAMAALMGAGFVPVRKRDKLPWKKVSEEYALEYGNDKVEMHSDAVLPSDTILIVDDLLATGGTVSAVCNLVEKQGAKVSGCAFIIELDFLKGREKLKGKQIVSLIHY